MSRYRPRRAFHTARARALPMPAQRTPRTSYGKSQSKHRSCSAAPPAFPETPHFQPRKQADDAVHPDVTSGSAARPQRLHRRQAAMPGAEKAAPGGAGPMRRGQCGEAGAVPLRPAPEAARRAAGGAAVARRKCGGGQAVGV